MVTYCGSATVDQVASLLTKVAKCPVYYCASIGDAACAVMLNSGGYVKQIGQVADYKHEVRAAAERINAASVIGHWNNDYQRWVCTVCAPSLTEKEIVDIVRLLKGRTLQSIIEEENRSIEAFNTRLEKWVEDRPKREAAAAAKAERTARLVAEYQEVYDKAVAGVPLNKSGKPNKGKLDFINYLFDVAVERCNLDAADHSSEQARRILRRLAGRE